MKKTLKLKRYTKLLMVTLLLVACTKNSDTVSIDDMQPEAIAFDSYLQRSQTATRTTYPTSGAGTMDNDKLKASSFGVFAQYTGATSWTDYNKANAFNFMWNQQVTWDALNSRWTYSPVKYWPNDNQPADDQGAQGSQPHSYLSFFAYAPYQAATTPPTGFNKKDEAGSDGIVEVVGNSTNASESYLYYRTSQSVPFDVDQSVDLLWACQTDRYKMDGGGYTTGTVDFAFKHALSLFTISVQGLFDHANNDDTSTLYPDDRDIYTKILVESVDFAGSPLFLEGQMFLVQNPVGATVPNWVVNAVDADSDDVPDLLGTLDINGENINRTFANRYLYGTWQKYWDENTPANGLLKDTDVDEDGDQDADDALALFNQLPTGVSHTEVPLDYTDYDSELDQYTYKYYMVLPNKEYRDSHSEAKMTVRMVYYVITYDERLTLPKTGYPKYFSIVKNDVTASFDAFSFEPNKKYKLRLQPGLTSAKFEVTMVDGWDTPLTLDPEVVDWFTTTTEFNVE